MKKAVVMALAVIMVLGVAAAAFAETSTEYLGAGGPPLTVSNTVPVTVTATVNPRLTLTITTPDAGQHVDFGTIYPGATLTAPVTVAVKSNKAWTMTKLEAGNTAELGLVTTVPATMYGANYGVKGEQSATDTYSITPPFTTDPGLYTATVVYTVTQ